jgi:hypothetical protein
MRLSRIMVETTDFKLKEINDFIFPCFLFFSNYKTNKSSSDLIEKVLRVLKSGSKEAFETPETVFEAPDEDIKKCKSSEYQNIILIHLAARCIIYTGMKF